MKKILTTAAVLGLASMASAQVFNLGNLAVNNAGISIDLDGASVAAGSYTSFTLTTDWVAGGGNPWSSDAIWALTDQAFTPGVTDPATTVFHADPGRADNHQFNGDSISLTWTGFFDLDYSGGDSLWLNALQTYGGSDATWNNVVLTLGSDTVSAPPAIDLGVIGAGNTIASANIAPGEVAWFSFEIDSAFSPVLSVDSLGSILTDNGYGANDTELAVYDASGDVIATNDDFDFDGDSSTPNLESFLDLAGLADGQYFLAASAFGTTFDDAFDATSAAQTQGSLKINFTVPAPGAAAMFGVASLAAARRRRA